MAIFPGAVTIPKGKAMLLKTDETSQMIDHEPDYNERKQLMSCESFDRVVFGRILWPPTDPDHDLVMIVDDLGWEFEHVDRNGKVVTMEEMFAHPELSPYQNRPTKATKPINKLATLIYLSICIPNTTHQIVGDVIIVHESWPTHAGHQALGGSKGTPSVADSNPARLETEVHQRDRTSTEDRSEGPESRGRS